MVGGSQRIAVDSGTGRSTWGRNLARAQRLRRASADLAGGLFRWGYRVFSHLLSLV